MSVEPLAFAQAQEPSAGGIGTFPLGQVLPATVMMLLTLLIMLAVYRGREGGSLAGRLPVQRWGQMRVGGLPSWAVVPGLVAFLGVTIIQLGIFWDVPLHIGEGREDGPFPNAGHWLTYVGVNTVLVAGWLSMCMASGRPSRASVRIREGWYVPAGALAVLLTAPMFLIQVPADDLWHRVYGQDVTLWSPTHLVLLWANPAALLATIALLSEGYAESRRRRPGAPRLLSGRLLTDGAQRLLYGILFGSLLVATTKFALEWDFGLEQFRLSIHALILGAAASLVLIAARLVGGPGVALIACAYFVVFRSLMYLFVDDVLGHLPPHFPLYLAEALIVEVAALAVGTARIRRFALVAGVGIGTIGIFVEWGWSHVFMPIAWPTHMIAAVLVIGLAGSVGGALVGAYIGGVVQRSPQPGAGGRTAVLSAVAGFLIILGTVGILVQKDQPTGNATVVLREVEGTSGGREAIATVRLQPVDYADGADFFTMTAWQGGQAARLIEMEKVGEGVYRTSQPVPLHGSWKSWLRLNRGSDLTALPIFLPEDRAIPKPEVSAPPRFTRSFESDKNIMQRETKPGIGWHWWAISYAAGLVFLAGWLSILTWCLQRLARAYRIKDRVPGGPLRHAEESPAEPSLV